MHNLNTELKGKTAIIITHRISSLLEFDKILVMEEGNIKEQGTHTELIEKKGLYFEMFERQQKEDILTD